MAQGPRPCYRAAIVSLALTSAFAMALAVLIRPPGPLPGTQLHIVAGALGAAGISALLGLASLANAGRPRPVAWLDRVIAPRARAAIALALAAWFPFLLIVVYYLAKTTFPPPAQYLYFPFDDKRWETAAYLLGVVCPFIWLTIADRVLEVGRDHPPTWRAWCSGLGPRAAAAGDAGPRPGRVLPAAAGLLTALGLAWYFTGPPWHLSGTSAPISRQEEVVLIGLQAVAKGHLPYVGTASVQYGPGTQVASYLLMRHLTGFSVVGFREAWALLVWVGVSVAFAVFFLAYGYLRGLAVSLLSALAYPALHTVAFQPGGTYSGYFGWASPLRYVGLIGLVLLLPAVVRRSPSRRGAAAGVGIGVLWGLTSYLAQENLSGGAVGALAGGALLVFSRTAPWRAVRAALAATLCGFLLVWTPVLACYAARGQLAAFLRQYLLFPRAVAGGANDTPWGGFSHTPSPYTLMFYTLPFLLAGLALLAVSQGRPLRVAAAWSPERVLLVMTVLATALLYEGVLLRSDTSHLTGTMLMVPALVIATATVLPRLLGARRLVTASAAAAVLLAGSLALLPGNAVRPASLRSWAQAPYLDRQRLAAWHPPAPPTAPPTALAASRVGPGLDAASRCCQGSQVAMPQLVSLMQRVHTVVGGRVAYVADFPGEYPGLVYFVADLNPAPVASDRYSSIETEPELTAFLADFRTRVLPLTQAVLTSTVQAPEAAMFLARYPGAHLIPLRYHGQPYYVLLR